MTRAQFSAFDNFRTAFRNKVEEWNDKFSSIILPLQQEMAGGEYEVETPIVYNSALDGVTKDSEIKLIIVGDNPGKTEQMAKRRAYMVGKSGAMASSFFHCHREIDIDFTQNVIILNKTPVHTAKTQGLYSLLKDKSAASLVQESQEWMARFTAALHKSLDCVAKDEGGALNSVMIWIVGYAQLRPRGVFSAWKDAFSSAYRYPSLNTNSAIDMPRALFDEKGGGNREQYIAAWQDVLVYQHFSMNRFTIDFNAWQEQHIDMPFLDALYALGDMHKKDIFTPLLSL